METEKQEKTKEQTEMEKVQEKIEQGRFFKKEITFQDEQFTPHRLSIGEKRQVAVLKAERTKELNLRPIEDDMVYMACWLDVALKDPKTGEWNAPVWWTGAESVYSDEYLIKLYSDCFEVAERPFFRLKNEQKGVLQKDS